MMRRLLDWLLSWPGNRDADDDVRAPVAPAAGPPSARPPATRPDAQNRVAARRAGRPPVPPSEPGVTTAPLGGKIESVGPGKNVLVRNRFVRENTGTHDTLKILDESLVDTGEEVGIDPYNTGRFDRSRNWDKRRN